VNEGGERVSEQVSEQVSELGRPNFGYFFSNSMHIRPNESVSLCYII